ncbi:hypothetical protein GCM10009535_45950 [Streptomyces thermocarboxydovorans]|uniref:Uncharacterized protein n=1 Tax=Streptomyces thermocarboxydovorans TaxID=59298 RepID=A0ABP3SZ33_9ACTN
MAVHEHPHRRPAFRFPSLRRDAADRASAEPATAEATAAGAYAMAGLRLLTGFVFLWAFLDKTFGLGYADPLREGLDRRGLSHRGLPQRCRRRTDGVRLPRLGRGRLGRLAVHAGPARHRSRPARGDRPADRRGRRDRDDGADVDRGMATGQAPVGRLAGLDDLALLAIRPPSLP